MGDPLTGDLTAEQMKQLALLVVQKHDELDLQTFQGLRPVGEDLSLARNFGGTARALRPNFEGLVFDTTEHTTARAIAENAAVAILAARTREAAALAAVAAAAAAHAVAAGAEAAQAEQGQGGPQARMPPTHVPRVATPARSASPPGSCTTRGLTPHAPPLSLRSCHAWLARSALRPAHVPRVARTPHTPGPGRGACLVQHVAARRTLRPPAGSRATRGFNAARYGPLPGACTTRGCTPHAPPPAWRMCMYHAWPQAAQGPQPRVAYVILCATRTGDAVSWCHGRCHTYLPLVRWRACVRHYPRGPVKV